MIRTVQLWILQRMFAVAWLAGDAGYELINRYGLSWDFLVVFADNKMGPAIDALADHWDFTVDEVSGSV